jgi:hypothetical protein
MVSSVFLPYDDERYAIRDPGSSKPPPIPSDAAARWLATPTRNCALRPADLPHRPKDPRSRETGSGAGASGLRSRRLLALGVGCADLDRLSTSQ